ncbi:hypothetical protein P7C70_g5440, partial [Phenoliferia sp. Uapishka_3]
MSQQKSAELDATLFKPNTGAPISEVASYHPGKHHYLLCLDPEDTDASRYACDPLSRALDYTKNRLCHAGDLVLLFSALSFSADGWELAGVIDRATAIVEDVSGAPITHVDSYEAGKHHYLLCLDPEDTDASKKALDYTKHRLAHKGDLVVLFSALQHPVFFPVDGWEGAGLVSVYTNARDEVEMRKLRTEMEDAAFKHLKDCAEGFAEGVRVHIRVVFGGAGPKVTEIVEACEFHKCEIIIVGRRKRGALQRWLGSGSVSTALLTNTDFSVLVVR